MIYIHSHSQRLTHIIDWGGRLSRLSSDGMQTLALPGLLWWMKSFRKLDLLATASEREKEREEDDAQVEMRANCFEPLKYVCFEGFSFSLPPGEVKSRALSSTLNDRVDLVSLLSITGYFHPHTHTHTHTRIYIYMKLCACFYFRFRRSTRNSKKRRSLFKRQSIFNGN